MKIGIISDTHKKIKKAKEAIGMLIDEGAKFIIHAGDIVEQEILDILEDCGVKYVAVYGNNDSHLTQHHKKYKLVQEPHYFKLAHTKFKLMHMPYYMSPDAEVIIFGHTHTFDVEFTPKGTLYLNPGESCARSKPISECAMLELKKDNFLITHYEKAKDDTKFKATEFEFKRKNLE